MMLEYGFSQFSRDHASPPFGMITHSHVTISHGSLRRRVRAARRPVCDECDPTAAIAQRPCHARGCSDDARGSSLSLTNSQGILNCRPRLVSLPELRLSRRQPQGSAQRTCTRSRAHGSNPMSRVTRVTRVTAEAANCKARPWRWTRTTA